jgi:hypothetical protein
VAQADAKMQGTQRAFLPENVGLIGQLVCRLEVEQAIVADVMELFCT